MGEFLDVTSISTTLSFSLSSLNSFLSFSRVSEFVEGLIFTVASFSFSLVDGLGSKWSRRRRSEVYPGVAWAFQPFDNPKIHPHFN